MTVFHHRLEDLIDQVPKVKLEIVGRYQMLDAAVQAVTDQPTLKEGFNETVDERDPYISTECSLD